MKSREVRQWTLTLSGQVQLRDPDGLPLKLPTRKAAGVLCVLTVAEGRPVTRKSLEEILWAEADAEKRTQSLRNTLAGLRRLLSDDGPLEISRTTCRLRSELIETDYPVTPDRQATLASDLEERWFVRLREGRLTAEDVGSSVATSPETLQESFVRVLSWAAEEDGLRALELMVAAPELTSSIRGNDLASLAGRLRGTVPLSHARYGWLLHFTGVASYLQGDLPAGIDSLHAAVEHARSLEDTRLMGETVRWLGAPYVVSGNADGARKLTEKSLSFVGGRQDSEALGLIWHAQGVAYHHLCRYGEAEEAMAQAMAGSYYRRDLAARAHLLANMSIFRAVRGDRAGAMQVASEAAELVASRPNWRVRAAVDLTEGLTLLYGRDAEAASAAFDRILTRRRSGEGDFTAIDIYAMESGALAQLLQGKRDQALQGLRASMQQRRKAHMGYTLWDRQRLKRLVQGLEV